MRVSSPFSLADAAAQSPAKPSPTTMSPACRGF
jgi:hypothetical protein